MVVKIFTVDLNKSLGKPYSQQPGRKAGKGAGKVVPKKSYLSQRWEVLDKLDDLLEKKAKELKGIKDKTDNPEKKKKLSRFIMQLEGADNAYTSYSQPLINNLMNGTFGQPIKNLAEKYNSLLKQALDNNEINQSEYKQEKF